MPIRGRERYNYLVSVERIGRYQIEDTLGRGAMGVVYRAMDTILEAPAAIKVFPPGTTADQQSYKELLKEALEKKL